jgi:hypothetical protein
VSAPLDTLTLWFLGKPAKPRWVGTLETARAVRGVSLRYAPVGLPTALP